MLCCHSSVFKIASEIHGNNILKRNQNLVTERREEGCISYVKIVSSIFCQLRSVNLDEIRGGVWSHLYIVHDWSCTLPGGTILDICSYLKLDLFFLLYPANFYVRFCKSFAIIWNMGISSMRLFTLSYDMQVRSHLCKMEMNEESTLVE